VLLRYLPPSREELGERKADDRSPVPGLLQLLRELGCHLVQRRDMLILKLDRDGNKAVLVLPVLMAVTMLMLPVSAVFVMRMFLLPAHAYTSSR